MRRSPHRRPGSAAAVLRLVAGTLAVAALGCASGGGPAPETAPAATPAPEPMVRPAPPTEEEPPVEAQPTPAEPGEEAPAGDAVEGAYGPRTVVIGGEAEGEEEPATLAEAAAAARRERRRRGESILVVTDENLEEHATGTLTVAEKPAGDAAPAAQPRAEESGTEAAGESPETYWRRRVLEARLAWREVVAEIDRLEGEVARLRHRFYAEDDPYYRDSQIKPAWDRALDRLSEARAAAGEAEARVEAILEEGRRAGALPGWLREGLEHEPAEEEPESEPIHEPSEPTIVDEDDGGD